MDMFPLRMSDVHVRRRGKRLLGPVDLTMTAGQLTAVIGPNGAGKTTLLRVMHGVERISGGTVTWAHDDPASHAYVFQTPILLRRSVAENLRYPLDVAGVPRAQANATVASWLDRIGLTDLRNLAASRLSGGERQKLAIARALARKPKVLFLDEPTANLDGHAKQEIEALLTEASSAGVNIILATHDMGQVRRLATQLVFLVAGRVVENGPAASAMSAPQTPQLAAFIKGDIVV